MTENSDKAREIDLDELNDKNLDDILSDVLKGDDSEALPSLEHSSAFDDDLWDLEQEDSAARLRAQIREVARNFALDELNRGKKK